MIGILEDFPFGFIPFYFICKITTFILYMQGPGYTDLNPSWAIRGLVAYPEIHPKYIPGQLFLCKY